ncbi:MAG: hypothetical protein RL375_4866 [Pseudomonadota bacterium]
MPKLTVTTTNPMHVPVQAPHHPGAAGRHAPPPAAMHRRRLAAITVAASLAGVALVTVAHAADSSATPAAASAAVASDSPAAFVTFVLETTSNCMLNNGQQVQMRSRHPSRTIRVWLDRFQRGIGTGDRSRTDLAPGAEPDPLGCSRSAAGVQEWRVVKAQFVD